MTDESGSEPVSRRGFFAATAGAAAATAAVAGSATARTAYQDEDEQEEGNEQDGDGNGTEQDGGNEQDGDGNGTENGGDEGGELPGAGETETVTVGPGGELVFEPDELSVLPGTTVEFVWDSNNHNVVVESGPDEGWEGYETIEDEGFTYEHTFEVEGGYEYICEPHVTAGMRGAITVTEDMPEEGEGQSGPGVPEVPSAAMSLAIGTIAAMASTLTLAYFFLKYGGQPEES